MEERSYNGGTSQMFVSRHSSSALHMWRCCSSCSHRRSLTAAGQFILATKYLNAPPFDELPLVHVAVAMKSTLRHISPHAIQFHCTVATFFVPPSPPHTPARSPIHPFMNEPRHVCVHQKCRWSQATSGQVCARTGLAWPGLGWAVHHRLRLSFVPRTSSWPPSSQLSCAASAVSFWCAPVKRANSHWNVSASSVVLFRVLFYMFILICCMFHMLFMAFSGDTVIVANVSITGRALSTLALLQLCHVMWWSVQIVKIVKTVQYILYKWIYY